MARTSGAARIKPRTITFTFLIAALVLALLVICRLLWPFAQPMGFALIMAVSLYPLHERVRAKIGGPTWAALVSTVAVLLLLIIPVIAIVYLLGSEMVDVGSRLTTGIGTEQAKHVVEHVVAPMGRAGSTAAARIEHGIDEMPHMASDYLIGAGSLLIAGFAGFAGQTIVTFFVLFFLFRDGQRMIHILAFLLPIQERHSQRLFEQVRLNIVANLKGMLVVAIVQGLLSAAAYYVLRLPSAGLLAFLTALASIVPVVGTALVWVPLAAYLALQGSMWKALAIFLWGLIVVAGCDNPLRAKVVGQDQELNPLFLILAILGGVEVFGVLGIFIGPLLLAVVDALVEMLRDEVIAAKMEELT